MRSLQICVTFCKRKPAGMHYKVGMFCNQSSSILLLNRYSLYPKIGSQWVTVELVGKMTDYMLLACCHGMLAVT